MSYVEDPKQFFGSIGGQLTNFHKALSHIESPVLEVIGSQAFDLMSNLSHEHIEKAMSLDSAKIQRLTEKIARMDLDKIVQNEDDVTPDNRNEKDVFRVREALFDTLYEGMQRLSKIPDEDEREEAAKPIIMKAIDQKEELKNLSMDWKKRKLRKDKDSDNEFYVARKRQIGAVSYERMPVPEVKMDEVVGKSFDLAKNHINQVIETGEHSLIMKLTSPRGKIKSNILLVGPYGCGKTELARAICADPRVIGVSISTADVLTAYMHESVSNVKRLYDQAAELRDQSRGTKPVVMVFDEYNGWFEKGEFGHASADMAQIEMVFREVLDGMEDYNGIITVAMTNHLKTIPDGIRRRFRFIDVVGNLEEDERAKLIGNFLEKKLPLTPDVANNYNKWAVQLVDAPGDVIGKVMDDVHFELIPPFLKENKGLADRITRVLTRSLAKKGAVGDKEVSYIRKQLETYNCYVTADLVDKSLKAVLAKPAIRQQIDVAREVYRESEEILNERADSSPFGLKRNRKYFS